MAMKPIVNGLEAEFQDELDIIHLDVQQAESQDFMEQYGFEYTPTFILLDGDGTERWRNVGALDTASLREALSELP
jgi:protein-disulfide isomerase